VLQRREVIYLCVVESSAEHARLELLQPLYGPQRKSSQDARPQGRFMRHNRAKQECDPVTSRAQARCAISNELISKARMRVRSTAVTIMVRVTSVRKSAMQPKMGPTPSPPVYLMLSFLTRRHSTGIMPPDYYGMTPRLLVHKRSNSCPTPTPDHIYSVHISDWMDWKDQETTRYTRYIHVFKRTSLQQFQTEAGAALLSKEDLKPL
jgi:hypothetical protein